jgi:hypothetical protein
MSDNKNKNGSDNDKARANGKLGTDHTSSQGMQPQNRLPNIITKDRPDNILIKGMPTQKVGHPTISKVTGPDVAAPAAVNPPASAAGADAPKVDTKSQDGSK